MPASRRESLIDAVRGLALFGILAVNIQTFSSGLSRNALGILDAASSVADTLSVLFLAFFFQYKFYPLFCFCFGYGFAIQTRRWRAQGINAAARFKRRTDFMLGVGALHGVLLWFGDILTSYAFAGKIISSHIGKGPKKLLQPLRFWLLATLLVAIPVTILLTADFGMDSVVASQDTQAKLEAAKTMAVYTSGGFFEALWQRASDYLLVTVGFLLTGAEVILFMLLGAWCAHAGVLRQPQRHAAFWQKVLRFGLIAGIPFNLAFAWAAWQSAHDPWGAQSLWQSFPGGFVPMLSTAYLALLALHFHSAPVQGFIKAFAPAGRYALTHYLTQSLAMFLLLGGTGLGLGAHMKQAELVALAFALYALQWLASHWMLQAGVEGPAERLWRRYTYRAGP
ncbi:MAG: DUF418 domain-containing protein [Betaproteobacteria bacterium]|nr:DUF418 domain-containing protein [Betaproteobacteria bacterium]